MLEFLPIVPPATSLDEQPITNRSPVLIFDTSISSIIAFLACSVIAFIIFTPFDN